MLTKRQLIHRKPEQWRSLIASIKSKPYRIQAACIVWWDYFSNNHKLPHPNFFTPLMQQWDSSVRLDPDLLSVTLQSIGYSPASAHQRADILRQANEYADKLLRNQFMQEVSDLVPWEDRRSLSSARASLGDLGRSLRLSNSKRRTPCAYPEASEPDGF